MNYTYFDNIDLPIKAYILGFICADGHINKNGNSLEIKIQLADKEIIDMISGELDCNTIYSGVRECWDKEFFYIRLNANSRYMVKSLLKLGLGHNKAFNLHIPDINENFINPFILGYFDGDGSLYINNNGMTSLSVASGSLSFLKKIKDRFVENDSIKKVFSIKPQGSIYVLRDDKVRDIVDIMSVLYDSSPFHLSRKYNTYQLMVDKYASIYQNRLCEADGCSNKHYAKGLCKKHYYKIKTI